MPSTLPMRCRQSTGRFQPKQVSYCKGCKKWCNHEGLRKGGRKLKFLIPPIPMQVFLLFLHFVAIQNFRFING